MHYAPKVCPFLFTVQVIRFLIDKHTPLYLDGWDRTTQIVSLVKIISDPNYRTFEGFERLIIRDWVEFGHKFNDRNGVTSTDTNERSPVFMQFMDAVHQLWMRNPDAFEFNQRYLVSILGEFI
jgi:hypothetical protein